MVTELVHGGDWAGYAAEYRAKPLDFSANVSPFGLPEGVRRAIGAAAAEADRYPDPLCRELRAALSREEGLPSGSILCGNGAADLIYRAVLARRPRRAVVTAPAFAEYESALALVGCEVERVVLREESGFAVEEDFLSAIRPGVEMVFLCQPNNPTGRLTGRALALRILAACEAVGALLVVDECFLDFTDRPEAYTLRDRAGRTPNLLILKAFTKIYGMAGVRLGWCLGEPELLDRMRLAGPPWAVSSLAQAAGIAALQERDYLRRVRENTHAERQLLAERLAALGLRVLPGEANFLLFYCGRELTGPLRRRGILLRSCANYPGLCAGWYRTAVRTRAENERLISALAECLEEMS